MNEPQKWKTFFTSLDLHLKKLPPASAIVRAAEDYNYIYHEQDGRFPVVTSPEESLRALSEKAYGELQPDDIIDFGEDAAFFHTVGSSYKLIYAGEVRDMLDNLIRFWRKERRDPDIGAGDRFMADCYIDAYQSVRSNIFGEVLQEEVSHGDS